MNTRNGTSPPDIIMLVPDGNGGINRLFHQLQKHADTSFKTCLTQFDSTDKRFLKMLRFPLRILRFLAAIRGNSFQLCHINLSTGGSALRKVIYASLCRSFGLPYVIHLHGGSYREFYAGLAGPLRNIVRDLFVKAERVIVLGTVWRDFVTGDIGVAAERTVVLPNAVAGPTAPHTVPSSAAPHLLFLGKIGPAKGIPELLEALADPRMQALDWTATLAGDGGVVATREAVSAAGLERRVQVPGWVGPNEVDNLLARSQILVLPSHVENLPLSMLEGMAWGLCPVVTPVGAVTDVIRHEDNGLLVPVKDAGALAEALVRVIEDADLRARLAANARRDFELHFDLRTYRTKLEAIYLDVFDKECA